MSGDLVRGEDGHRRCSWGSSGDFADYHDREWGRPVVTDAGLLERIVLEGFQSGLSWLTILRKRENFRAAFAGFDPDRLARFDDADVERLLADAGIIRNRRKIEAAIANGRAARDLMAADGAGALARLIWSFAPPKARPPRALGDIPPKTPESVALTKALKQHGFAFVGPTTIYALMQACGVVNDHISGCFVRGEVGRERTAALSRLKRL